MKKEEVPSRSANDAPNEMNPIEKPKLSSGKINNLRKEVVQPEPESFIEPPQMDESPENEDIGNEFSIGFRAMQTNQNIESANSVASADGVTDFYWFDAYEDSINAPGTVFLLGKVKCGDSDYQSCCMQIRNIQRNVFFLPRAEHLDSKP